MNGLIRAADAMGRLTARFVPSAFAIAVILTLVSFVLAFVWADAGVPSIIAGWGGGFWKLLEFSMQMGLVMFTGYLLALTRPVRRMLQALASLAKTPRSAVVLMALSSMGLTYLNWGLSIVASAMLVRFVVKRQPDVDYRLLVACAYFGLGATWHAGLSASAPLLVATPKHFLSGELGIIPISETLFSPFNLATLAGAMALLTFLAFAMHPKPEATVRVRAEVLSQLGDFDPPVRTTERGVAAFLDFSPVLNRVFAAIALVYFFGSLMTQALPGDAASTLSASWNGGHYGQALGLVASEGVPDLFRSGWRFLNINSVNFLFFTLAVWLHRTPTALIKASEEAASVLSGVVLQFPLYAGIYGVFASTGLTDKIGAAFVSMGSQRTFPGIVYLYSGIVNYFVPSGGAKWAIEAPYLLKAAQTLNVAPAKVVLAYAWGDMATDLIQPFWALPLLTVAKLEFKDILGFLLLTFCFYVPLVTLAFFLFG